MEKITKEQLHNEIWKQTLGFRTGSVDEVTNVVWERISKLQEENEALHKLARRLQLEKQLVRWVTIRDYPYADSADRKDAGINVSQIETLLREL